MPKILILWLASGVTPNLRHDSNTGTVTITSSVSVTNDTAWHTLVATWRPRRLELYLDGISRANSTAANTNTSDAFGIYRRGWGFSTNQDFNGDIALILCCGACWTGHMVRRWHADPFGFRRPWGEVPALMGSAPPAAPPSSGTGMVTFLMGWASGRPAFRAVEESAGMIDWIKVAQGWPPIIAAILSTMVACCNLGLPRLVSRRAMPAGHPSASPRRPRAALKAGRRLATLP